ncbi:RNA polymerase sigma factor [Stieleria neptunia]|uniref:RNA polymerase sigma factor n=1 Tax=Stieleria neptunia TaxID=2527979 RepID=A0A518I432_9BACT|nr:sigma-70 family RNA polymerase sigma factor [Stieleria neptunia]QDV47816.1 RNA polymerase sigma factor [Stieleria neptunia]
MESISTSDLVNQASSGNRPAADQLIQQVYEKLRALAAELLRHESPTHTLQPTALVNEVYLRMVDQNRVDWKATTHFYAISARMMRRILVDHARGKKREKRGGGRQRIELEDDLCVTHRNDEDVLAVDDAIVKLASLHPRQAEIVELRFFGGLSVAQVAETLGVSKRTVEADWTFLRAWLRRELSEANDA